ncbi:hypothetical protein KR093_006085, partial [Drosophila rubida]
IMACICCRCGTLREDGTATLCLPVTGTQNFHCHCFCCIQPPRMKCFHCNMWRDLEPMESHGPCVPNKLHLFVNSEPWPPFPVHTPQPPIVGMVVTLGNAQEVEPLPEVCNEPEEDSISEASVPDSTADRKPQISRKAKWVSIGDIRKWNNCIRCGMVKIKTSGWLRHAQKCGQDSSYTSRRFFIYLHTLAWCNTLVNDTFWEQHTNTTNGKCKICRMSRLNKIPLPYQPKPPSRKNEARYAKQRQSRLNKSRIKRRQSMAAEVPGISHQ